MLKLLRKLLKEYKALPADEKERLTRQRVRVQALGAELFALVRGQARGSEGQTARNDEDDEPIELTTDDLGKSARTTHDARPRAVVMSELNTALVEFATAIGPQALTMVQAESRRMRWASKAVGFGVRRAKK